MCEGAEIRGSGFQKYMIAHGLKATMTTLLIEAGHGGASVVLRMDYSDINTLSRYRIVQGIKG